MPVLLWMEDIGFYLLSMKTVKSRARILLQKRLDWGWEDGISGTAFSCVLITGISNKRLILVAPETDSTRPLLTLLPPKHPTKLLSRQLIILICPEPP